MTQEAVMTLGFNAMKVGLMLSTPPLLAAMMTGLLVSILQASTQINEMTLSFIPKIFSVITSLVIAGPWMFNLLVDYIHALFKQLPYLVE